MRSAACAPWSSPSSWPFFAGRLPAQVTRRPSLPSPRPPTPRCPSRRTPARAQLPGLRSPSNNAASPLLPRLRPPLPAPSQRADPLAAPARQHPPARRAAAAPARPRADRLRRCSPTASGAVLTNGAPGTTPATETARRRGDHQQHRRGPPLPVRLPPLHGHHLRRQPLPDLGRRGRCQPPKKPGVVAPLNNTPRRAASSRSDVFFSVDPSVSLGYGDFLTRATNYIELDYNADVLFFTKNTRPGHRPTLRQSPGRLPFCPGHPDVFPRACKSSTAPKSAPSAPAASSASGGPEAPSTQVNLDASQRTALDISTPPGSTPTTPSRTKPPSISTATFPSKDYRNAHQFRHDCRRRLFQLFAHRQDHPRPRRHRRPTPSRTEPAPDEYFQQVNLRLSYVATGKLSFCRFAGPRSPGKPADTTAARRSAPVFNLNVSYAPFDSTTLSLNASRQASKRARS